MSGMTLRPYQTDAINAIRAEMRAHQSTLVVMATGLGKTVTFAEIARLVAQKGGRTLILAHRGELLTQAQGKLLALGVEVGVEKASQSAGSEPVVVASVQTLRGDRLAAWPRDVFRMVVVDEAHRATAKSYRDILDHFSSAKVLGVTATPDRLDGKGMGEVFESVAYRYGMRAAIRDGWLVPLKAQRVHVDGLDLSAVRTAAADLHQGELDEAMRACVDGVAEPLVRLAGERPTIVFGVTVAHAHAMAEALNRRRPGSARAIDGTAKAEARAFAIEGFHAGDFQFLVNCALFTEGFDAPATSCVAVVRPTKSRALYTQMVGRGTRLSEGKGDCLILDFGGNSGRHSLAGPSDVLGGHESDDVRALLQQFMESGAVDLEDALDQAQHQSQERREGEQRRKLKEWWAEAVNPFLVSSPASLPAAGPAATERQRDFLQRKGLKLPEELPQDAASRLIANLRQRHSKGLSSYKQSRLLARHGIDARAMSFDQASQKIGTLLAQWQHQTPQRGVG